MSNRAVIAAVTCTLFAWQPPAAMAGPTLLFDAGTGHVLYAEDQDDQWYPASLTKIMTAYITFEAIRAGKLTLDTKIKCSEAAFAQPPSKIGLPVGAEMTVETALQALIVKSANDVAVMLAEAVAGSEQAFVDQMNATAQRLGMSRTRFANANGLPAADQITTARDLARLSTAVIRDFPEYRELWAMADMRLGKRRIATHNGLLKTYEGADGLKTGFICDAGFNVVASATRDGHRLMAVVLGESSGYERTLRAASLLEHGFQVHAWKQMLGAPTIDSLPLSADAKPAVSVRSSIVSWDCGGRRPVRTAKSRAKKPAQSAEAAAADTAAPAAAGKPARKAEGSEGAAPGSAPPAKPKSKAAMAQPKATGAKAQ
jgi:D-alanyl-D-alanine carboxypeptidase